MTASKYRVPPLYFDKDKDAETIENLEAMVNQSPFKSKSEFIRHMVKVFLPVLKNHPSFSTKAAIASLPDLICSNLEQSVSKVEQNSINDEQDLTVSVQERTIEW
jgi:hypothetical protein